jgi:hypothetical protein
MDWQLWCETYPARAAKLDDLVAQYADGPYDDQIQAEKHKEWLEMTHERGGFEVVKHLDKFFVIG